ncbi:MAG: hypothetical protein ACFFD2_05920 [Promethearchaeota archaeon]
MKKHKFKMIISLFLFFLLFCTQIFMISFIKSFKFKDSDGNVSNVLPYYFDSCESIENQTFYFWNGTVKPMFQPLRSWSGSENYTLFSSDEYSVTENFNGTLYHRNINDLTRIISKSNNSRWENSTHELFWIHTSIQLHSIVLVSNAVSTGDYTLNVTNREKINLWGKNYTCWKLIDIDGSNTVAYYDCNTGFLINGTFDFGGIFTYTFYLVKTNAQPLPNFKILTPDKPAYYKPNIPIIVKNYTNIESIWFRNSSNGGLSWSENYTLSWNGIYYINSTNLFWEDGNYLLHVFANNSFSIIRTEIHNFFVSAKGPNIELVNPLNTTYFYNNFELLVKNYSYVNYLWYRFNIGTGWTENSSLTYNGSFYKDATIIWDEGSYHLQIFANDSIGETAQRDIWFQVDITFPLNISSNVITDRWPKIVSDTTNRVHIVWIKNSSNTFEIIYVQDINGHLGIPQTIYNSVYPLYELNLAIDPFDVIHLCWMEKEAPNTDIFYMNNTGGSFGIPDKVPRGELERFSEVNLAIDFNGWAHMVIIGYNLLGGNHCVYYINNTGGTFSSPDTIETDALTLYYSPVIALDSLSVGHIFWVDNSTGNLDIFYQNTSNSFQADPIQISYNLDIDFSPAITVDTSGTIHVTWTTRINNQYSILYKNISSGKCSSLNYVSNNFSYFEIYPQIAIDTGTTPDSVYIVWLGAGNAQDHLYIIDNRKGSFDSSRNICLPSINSSSVDLIVQPFEGQTCLVWSGVDGIDKEIYYAEDYNPILLLIPANKTYSYYSIELKIINSSSHLTHVWCRNRTSTGGWSPNYTLTWNGNWFSNSSTIYWPFESDIIIQIFSNDTNGQVFSKYIYFTFEIQQPDGLPPRPKIIRFIVLMLIGIASIAVGVYFVWKVRKKRKKSLKPKIISK